MELHWWTRIALISLSWRDRATRSCGESFFIMDYKVNLPGFEKQELVWRTGAWKNSMVLDGSPLTGQGRRRNEYTLKDDHGHEQSVVLKSRFLDPVPIVVFGPEEYHLAPPISLAQYLFAAVLLFPLLFAGGALGGAMAGGGFLFCLSFFRSDNATWLKYLTVLGASLGVWILYLIVATAITVALH